MLVGLKGFQMLGEAGNIGRIAATTAGVLMAGKTGWDEGTAINNFASTARDYNAHDPASQARYYAAVTGLTELDGEHFLMIFAGAKDTVARWARASRRAGEPRPAHARRRRQDPHR